jgi:uncharacterized protein
MIRTAILLVIGVSMASAADYPSEIAAWRRAREAALKADAGWLTLAGLFWLHDGANRFGRDASNAIVLSDGPALAGSFQLQNGEVTVTMDGATRKVAHDSGDSIHVGRLSLQLIRRGGKYAIRLRDPDSEYRRNFHGIESYPVDEAWRITARFVPEPRKIPILNIIGQTEDDDCPGYAVFQIHGREYRLYPIFEEPGAKELFYIFRDLTSGKETYGAGRFFYSALPENGRVVLDFNKAYNPPCAFTPYATCPLPPKENRLDVKVDAGEKKYH